MLSIITATLNARAHIEILTASLRSQTDKEFEWVVADGGSTDGTLEYLRKIEGLNVRVICRKDFGIYDALNNAIRESVGDYYVVIGADDEFGRDAVEKFKHHIDTSGADIVTAKVNFGGVIRGVRGRNSAIQRQFAFVSSHAVATAFCRKLHERFGFYSSRFPIAADQLFIMTACRGGAVVYRADFVAGSFNTQGLSSHDTVGALTESFRIQLKFHNRFHQTCLFVWKLIRRYRSLR
ncbi:PGL/p-HBAD biosynthesis glycosyltransferase [compost metagenome]